MSKLVIKVFTTFDEQMQILEERKLNFSNLKEKDKMRNYLVKFGYRNLITEYSSHFMISFDLNMKQYTQNVYASHIMNLFELDINISEILLSKIFEIERRLSTSISYCLMQHYKMKYPVMNNGLLLTLKDEEIADIFTS
jgi:abortive infection bacteriophage resistance protein